MAQIRESNFVIMDMNDEDIDLMRLDGGGFVSVETEHSAYDEEIEQIVSELNPGDIIQVQIQSEDVLQPNAIWRFLELEHLDHDPGWAWDD